MTRHYFPYELEMCRTRCQPEWDLTTAAYQVHQATIARQCQEFKLPFIDLNAAVRAKEAKGEHLYWNYDEHMRGKGYLFLGKTIWELWQASGQP